MLITIVVTILVVGLLLWAVASLPFIDASMKQLARVVIIVAAVLWLLKVLGLFSHLGAL